MENEIWIPIGGFEGYYEASSFGRIKTIPHSYADYYGNVRLVNGKIKILSLDKKRGYLEVKICKGKFQKSMRVHRLVATAFHPNPDNKKNVNHKDGVKTNNHASNLEWATDKENVVHAYANGLMNPAKGERSGQSKLTNEQVLEIFASTDAQWRVAEKYGVTQKLVGFIKTGVIWRHITGAKYKRFKLTEQDNNNIRNEYTNGSTLQQLSIKYEREVVRICKILNIPIVWKGRNKGKSTYIRKEQKYGEPKIHKYSHGTITSYQMGCRCIDCKTEAKQKYLQKKATPIT